MRETVSSLKFNVEGDQGLESISTTEKALAAAEVEVVAKASRRRTL
jgi:hypothetical protein